MNEIYKCPCDVSKQDVGRNSVMCISCKVCIRKGFSGLTGRLQHPVDFQCVKCKNWVFKVEPIKKFVRHKNVSLECADEF